MYLSRLNRLNKKYFLTILLLLLVSTAISDCFAEDTNDPAVNNDPKQVNLSEISLPEEATSTNYDLNLEDSINFALDNNSIFNIQKKQTNIYKIKATKTILDFLPTLNTGMKLGYQTNIADLDTGGMTIPGVGLVSFTGFQVEQNWKRENNVSAT